MSSHRYPKYGTSKKMDKCVRFCNYVVTLCKPPNGKLNRIEDFVSTNTGLSINYKGAQDQIRNLNKIDVSLQDLEKDVDALYNETGVAPDGKKSEVVTGSYKQDGWDCTNIINKITAAMKHPDWNVTHNGNALKKFVVKTIAEIKVGVSAVIKHLHATVKNMIVSMSGADGADILSDDDDEDQSDGSEFATAMFTEESSLQEIVEKMSKMGDKSLRESLLRFFGAMDVADFRRSLDHGDRRTPLFSKSAMSAANEASLLKIQDHALGNGYTCTLRVLSAFEECRPYFHSLKSGGGDWILTPGGSTPDDITSSPLWWACQNNHFSVVEAFIGKRDMSHRIQDLYDPIYPDPSKSNHSCEQVQKLLQEHHVHNLHLRNVRGQTLVEVVAEQGDEASAVLQLLVSHDPSIVEVYTCPEKEESLLGLFARTTAPAARCTHMVVEIILGNSPRWATFRLRDGNMVAHWACKHGNVSVLQSLLLPHRIPYVLTSDGSTLEPGKDPEIDAREAIRRFAYQVVARDHSREGDNLIALFLQGRNNDLDVLDETLFCKIFAISARMACNHGDEGVPGNSMLAWFKLKYDAAVSKWDKFIKDQATRITFTNGDWTQFYCKYAGRRNEAGHNISDIYERMGDNELTARWTLVANLLMGDRAFFSPAKIRVRNSEELDRLSSDNGIDRMKEEIKAQSWCSLDDAPTPDQD